MTGRLGVLTIAFLAALVTFSTIVATVLDRGSLALSTRTVTRHLRFVTQGTLIIKELPVFPPDPEPRSGGSLSITGSAGRIAPNASGSGTFALGLDPGTYTLNVTDPRFRLSIPFQILVGNVTVVTLLVVKHAAFPYYIQASDKESTGWIAGGGSVLTGFFFPSGFVHENDLAFVQVPLTGGYSGIDSNATGRFVVTDVSARGEAIFVRLQALRQFRVTDLGRSLVAVYDPTYTVRVVSGDY